MFKKFAVICTAILLASFVGVALGFTLAGGGKEELRQIIPSNDKNMNGVWDRVESYIDMNYPDPSQLKNALYQVAVSAQDYAEDGRQAKLYLNASLTRSATECVYSILGEESGRVAVSAVKGRVLDNSARWYKYLNAEKVFGPSYLPRQIKEQWGYACDFIPARVKG